MEDNVVDMEKYRDSLLPERLLEMDTRAAEVLFNKLPFKRRLEKWQK